MRIPLILLQKAGLSTEAVVAKQQTSDESHTNTTSPSEADTETASRSTDQPTTPQITVPLSQQDYILGIADLTGKLRTIQSICWCTELV